MLYLLLTQPGAWTPGPACTLQLLVLRLRQVRCSKASEGLLVRLDCTCPASGAQGPRTPGECQFHFVLVWCLLHSPPQAHFQFPKLGKEEKKGVLCFIARRKSMDWSSLGPVVCRFRACCCVNAATGPRCPPQPARSIRWCSCLARCGARMVLVCSVC